MSKHVRIRTPTELLAAIKKEPMRFFNRLNFGALSAKTIEYSPRRRVFVIHNEIDDTTQKLTCAQLMNPRYTNIGIAMKAGAFFAETY
jgi:hypothetical protein